MESLFAYVPIDRRNALFKQITLAEQTYGTALFADISQFTNISEMLADDFGAFRGAEELTNLLNSIFTPLIESVHRFGGSVIGFSGDALTCWFDHTVHGDAHEQRGIACAAALQETTRHFSFTAGYSNPITLSLKTAVVSGPAFRFLVGDPDIQWVEALAGGTLTTLAQAEKLADKGEIIVTQALAERYGPHLHIESRRESPDGSLFASVSVKTALATPHPWQPLDLTAMSATLRAWLLPALRDKIEQSKSSFLAELRPIVAMFVRFDGISYDSNPDAKTQLDAFIKETQHIVAGYGGHLLQLTIGDKGSYIYIVWGAPTATGDDVSAALSAALAIRRLPHSLSFLHPLQIGISQGRVHAGAYGHPNRRTYGVLGKTVNLAARLMSLAEPDQILASQTVRDAAKSTFRFEKLPPQHLKGFAAAVEVFQLGDTAVLSATANKVTYTAGRKTELAQMARTLRTFLEKRQSHNVLISGEAGIGKSHLVSRFQQLAHELGIATAVGVSNTIERGSPYHSWRNILTQIIYGDEEKQSHIQLEHFLSVNAPKYANLAPLLNTVFLTDIPENELTRQMSGQVRADNINGLLVHLLNQASAQAPLMLILEDAHWFDSASWELLRRVINEGHALFIVLSMRPVLEEQRPEPLTLFRTHTNTVEFALDTLERPAIESLVCNKLGVQSLPDSVAAFIHERAEGHPFFSEELAYSLRDSGFLSIKAGQCIPSKELTHGSVLDFPDTIQGVIISRLDQLSYQEQLALKVASVIGRLFTYQTLYDVFPEPSHRPQLKSYLQHLEHQDITSIEHQEPALAYLFKHALTHDISYGLLLFAQKQQLHRAVAAWYESAHENDLTAAYAILAHHWQKTVDVQNPQEADITKAIDYLEKAAEQADKANASRETIQYLEQALKLNQLLQFPHGRLRLAKWYRLLSNAAFALGNFEQSEQYGREGLALLGEQIPESRARFIQRLFGQVIRQVPRRLKQAEQRPFITDPHLLTDEDRREYEICAILNILSTIYYVQSESGKLFISQLLILNHAENMSVATPALARGFASAGFITGLLQQHRLARHYFMLASNTARQLDNLPTIEDVCRVTGLYHVSIGAWDEAAVNLDEAFSLSETIGNRVTKAGITMVQIINLLFRGLFNEALPLVLSLRQLGQALGNPIFEIWSLNSMMYLLMAQGKTDHFEVLTLQVKTLLAQNPIVDQDVAENAAPYLARIALQNEDRVTFKEHFKSAAPLIDLISPARTAQFLLIDCLAELLLTLVTLDETESGISTSELNRTIANFSKRFKSFAAIQIFAKPRLFLFNGRLHYHAGNTEKAVAYFQKALHNAANSNMPYDQALTRYYMGKYQLVPGSNELLTEATEQLEQLGAHAYGSNVAHRQIIRDV